ncbi:MAG: peptidase M23 [Rhodobacterales bacterium]|nr:MAG: peptidase M23 [Rhodobacterales bacterium]
MAHTRNWIGAALLAPLALAGCTDGKFTGFKGLDFDLRGLAGGFSTADAARKAAPTGRPKPDSRGVISYPTYQVVVARAGDTVAQIAARLGFGPNELGRYNGIPPQTTLRAGEILALPRMLNGGGATAAGTLNVTEMAGNALDRLEGSNPTAAAAPVRHQVARGETAYSIARTYNVPVNALASWNSLDSSLSIREGQYLLIPTVNRPTATASLGTTAPGVGSPTPLPPSAAVPLPDADESLKTPTTPASPGLGETRTAATAARMVMPVEGRVARAFERGKTDGVDISAKAGATVRAAAAGTVAAITRDTDQVPILVIKHSGSLLTVYAGIDNIAVSKGEKVSAGQAIASVRAATPPFLHFQVRKGTQSVDPMGYLN